MSSPSTRETLTGLDKAEFLIMSTQTQQEVVHSKLTEAFSGLPSSEGEVLPPFDWSGAQSRHTGLLTLGVQDVKSASGAHRLARIRVSEFARGRQAGASELRSYYRSLQRTIASACGTESLQILGLDVPPVRPLLGVREQCGFVSGILRDPAFPAQLAAQPKPVAAGPTPDPLILADGMDSRLEAFEQAQRAWTQAKKIRDEAYLSKKAAQKRLNRLVTNVARVQEGYYRLAGLDELADRIRLTIRRSAKKVVVVPDAGEPDVGEPDVGEPDVGEPDVGTPAVDTLGADAPTPPTA